MWSAWFCGFPIVSEDDLTGLVFLELQRQLTFTTSSTKKRKLSPQHNTLQETYPSPDIPLNSVEDCESQTSSEQALPRFDFTSQSEAHSDNALPPHIPSHLHPSSSFSGNDCISSAASSPTAAYAGLSIESDYGGDSQGCEVGARSQPLNESNRRSQSPNTSRAYAYRAIMGGAADLPQRSSSPLKRPASDLENNEGQTEQADDVKMEGVDESSQTSAVPRAGSVDMLREEVASPSSSVSTLQNSETKNPETDIPSIDYQIKTVTSLCQAALQNQAKEGDKVYLVSRRWLKRVQDRSSEARQNSKEEPEGEIGPIDNSDIIKQRIKDSDGQDFVQLKPGSGTDAFELFPEDAWNLVVEWYGLMPGSIPIVRYAHNTNPDKMGIPNMSFEFHPPIFSVHRLWSQNSALPLPQKLKATNPPTPIFVVSRSVSYNEFLKRIKKKTEIDLTRKVRVWRVPRSLPAAEPAAPTAASATPPSSRTNSPAPEIAATQQTREPQDTWTTLLLDVESFSKLQKGVERELIGLDDNTNNPKYNGHIDLAMAGLGDDQAIVLDTHISGSNYVLNEVPGSSAPPLASLTATRGQSYLGNQANSQANSGRSSPAPSGPITRGRTQKSGRTIGCVGLSNLGNTCYMNSALQCVRSVEELTKYFLTGNAGKELNPDNPLGNNGEVATAYEALLRDIYRDPPPQSIAPRYFKATIGRYAPSFSGYGQQDSQEFVGFLLDGLQEDLSRVKKKPYIEKPDSTDEMVNNPEAIREMAAKVWDITKKRDDSVIADLFTGMYKSTLVCPVCAKVSITFDPFNNLTLQLPIESSWSHDVYFFPLNDRPMTITVDLDKQASIKALKEFISTRTGVPAERLFAAEEFKSKFYKTYDDYKVASEEIGANDNVAVYELEDVPTNWPAPRKPAKKQKVKSSMLFPSNNYGDSDEDEVPSWDDPLAGKMLIPVIHRRPNVDHLNRNKGHAHILTPVPHFIVLTPEEARNEDIIRRKVLEKVATFTTHPAFSQDDDDITDSGNDSVDPDTVLTSVSDADSSGDGKVVASSVDGEEELVNVTMKDTNKVRESIEPRDSNLSKRIDLPFRRNKDKLNKRRPKFMAPGSYLEPEMQNMFELCYFSGQREMIPTGWTAVDETKTFPRLSSRNPVPPPPTAAEEELENDYDMTNGRATSETSDEDEKPAENLANTRMTEESSEEEDQVSLPVRPPGQRNGVRVGYNSKRRNRGMKTYSKKGNLPGRLNQKQNVFEKNLPDDGPLIRLGEGIVVEWQHDAWIALFDGDRPDDNIRGMPTYSNMRKFEDDELIAKRKARAARRKNGITLDDCLNEFGKEEILSEMDTWYCPRCKEHRRASKKFELWKSPDILVIHLKRFSSSSTRRDKLDVFVDFPVEGLDLTSRVIDKEDGKQEIYDLIAVDDHWGGLGGGHYTAFAKSFIDGEWYEYNDSSVSKQKDVSRVVGPSAYLLFYRRRSDVPLGGPRFKEIFEEYDNPHEADQEEEDDTEAAESGEEHSLGVDSSLRGSSSALTGVGAAHPRLGPGLDSSTVSSSQIDDDKLLPSYQEHLEDDGAPLLMRDAEMNDGLPLHDSIEDEAIDMSLNYNNLSNLNYANSSLSARGLVGSWNFDNLGRNNRPHGMVSGTGSDVDDNYLPSDANDDIDDRSDIVQHDSSASEGSIRARYEEFTNAIPEGEDGIFVDPSPVPDLDEKDQMDIYSLHRDMLAQRKAAELRPEFEVPAETPEDIEEPAAEIHVEEGEGLKMDEA
ncbi:ubiquitin carboxyl-terminal hydrolase-like protein [Xylogone sp. PMI_703]|nr:ubiquitin carboxyl-terminal hydrolase-like protein [Xylogone sp. PMI_703]